MTIIFPSTIPCEQPFSSTYNFLTKKYLLFPSKKDKMFRVFLPEQPGGGDVSNCAGCRSEERPDSPLSQINCQYTRPAFPLLSHALSAPVKVRGALFTALSALRAVTFSRAPGSKPLY